MQLRDFEELQHHPVFLQLIQRKKRLTWTLTGIMLLVYYSFVLVMAFAPQIFQIPINGGVTNLGIVLTITVILLSFASTAYYVWRSNNVLDPLTAKLLEEVRP